MALDNHGTFEAENGDFDQFFKELNTAVAKRSESDVLKGQIANKGKAKGIVRIVLDPHDDKGFKDGDILVTSMTRPEFVPLMRRAAAVVTNEGGITSHAAIVSRELRIPCIIATKIATQFLKDGDMVEVDADQGIVTIIK
jgi:pyruvate,water dikinase